ncbi:hypothetical protein GCM10023329_30380 [Streptomyces sanyensis]|uniref:Uncharacterized protein n=1 Tax=Streptomyces sanyensis TaxID=568869 RepID=A0ABP9ACR9_9ACTN
MTPAGELSGRELRAPWAQQGGATNRDGLRTSGDPLEAPVAIRPVTDSKASRRRTEPMPWPVVTNSSFAHTIHVCSTAVAPIAGTSVQRDRDLLPERQTYPRLTE